MHKIDALQNMPMSWKELFFSEIDGRQGS